MNVDVNFGSRIGNIAVEYVKALDVKVTRNSFRQAFEQHPYYPSVFALKKVFTRFDIESDAFDLPPQELQNLDGPFMAYVSIDGNTDFVLVTSINSETVTYQTGDKKIKKISKENFLDAYRKIVFVAEGNERSGEKHYAEELEKEVRASQKQKVLAVGGVLILLAGILMLIFPSIAAGNLRLVYALSSISLIKLGGLAATILLLMHEIDNTNSITRSICSASRKGNCDAILSSKAAKIFGVSWSEIGFFYFTATTLLLFVPILDASTKVISLAFSGTLIFPFVAFSIYYQWRIAKQWCILCLAVQAAIVLEFLWSIGFFWTSSQSTILSSNIINLSLAVFTSVLLPVTGWYWLKPVFISARKSSENLAGQKRLQHNPEIFNALLQRQNVVADGWQDLGITIGNPYAKHTILKVCNPFCGPCAVAHPHLEDVIRENPDYKLKVIFTTYDDPEDGGRQVVQHLLAIADQNDISKTAHALDAWYGAPKKEYSDFAAKFPMNGEIQKQNEKIKAMRSWCDKAEISYTPTIFIDGRLLPANYHVDQLRDVLQK